jgi:hypothetical protein
MTGENCGDPNAAGIAAHWQRGGQAGCVLLITVADERIAEGVLE